MTARTRVLLVGVGGHGVVTAARTLGEAGRSVGLPVRIGQIHGMSQRGGSVESTVVFGPGQTALIGEGEADVVLGFEPIETWRAIGAMSSRTVVVANRDRVSPYDMSRRGEPYPDLTELFDSLRQVASHVVITDAASMAGAAGDPRAVGTVLLGVIAGVRALPFGPASLLAALERVCPRAALEANLRAFAAGLELGERDRAESAIRTEERVTT